VLLLELSPDVNERVLRDGIERAGAVASVSHANGDLPDQSAYLLDRGLRLGEAGLEMCLPRIAAACGDRRLCGRPGARAREEE
jgi:hypothetical protein